MAAVENGVGLLSLPDELILAILLYVDAESPPPRIDQRAFMSAVSFKVEPDVAEASVYLWKLRETCQVFGRIGLQILLKRVTVRFTNAGFNRLRLIAMHPHMAGVVQKFSYVVPRFFFEDQMQLRLFGLATVQHASTDLRNSVAKAKEQLSIRESSIDVNSLVSAFVAFKNLQHVRLLRVEDTVDRSFKEYLHHHGASVMQHVNQDFTSAYTHCARTLARAYLSSSSSASWFSFDKVDVQTALSIKHGPDTRLTAMVGGLECLLLRFDNPSAFQANLIDLSRLFGSVIEASSKLVALHIGFPSGRHVNVPLEEIFQNRRLEKLRVLSLEGWIVDGEEIETLVRRHRETLRGLRLRGVLLKQGSMWRDVLSMIRSELELRWLSLSDADYEENFQGIREGNVDRTDDSDSDLQSESDLESVWNGSDMSMESDGNQGESDDDMSQSDSVAASVSDRGAASVDLNMRADTPVLDFHCTCTKFRHVDDLNDNGRSVTKTQRRFWEHFGAGCRSQYSTV